MAESLENTVTEEFLFSEEPLLGSDSFFEEETTTYDPEITPESQAYGRGLLISLLGPEDQIPNNILPISEANTLTQQSEEEKNILSTIIQDELLITKAAGTDVLLNAPSLQTMELLEEYYATVATNNINLVEEVGKVTSDKADLDKPFRFARKEVEAWFNLNKTIAAEQLAFDSFIKNDNLLGDINSWLNFILKNTLPMGETTGLRAIFQKTNPEGAKKYFDPLNTDPLNIGYAGTGETLLLGNTLDALTQSIIDAKPSVRKEMITKLFKIVQDNPNTFPLYKGLFNWKSRDGINKKLQMGELLHEINKGNIDNVDWDKHVGNLRGVLGLIPLGGVLAKSLKASKWSKAGANAFRNKTARAAGTPDIKLSNIWIHEEGPTAITGKKPPKLLTKPDSVASEVVPSNPDIFNGANLDSTLDVLDATDPIVAGKIFTTLDRQVVEMYGLRAEDVVSRFMPVPKGFSTSGMSEAALGGLKGTITALEQRMQIINPSFHITPNEKAEVLKTLKARLASKVGFKLFTGKTTVEHTEKGFVIEAMYGKDEVGGFGTLSEVKAGLAHVGANPENMEVIAINPISNVFEVVTASALKDTREIVGDFYIRVKDPHLWSSDSVLDFQTGNLGGEAYTPVVAGGLTPNQFTFAPFLVLSAARSADIIPTIATHLNPLVKPFLKANKNVKIKVTDALRQGDAEARVLSQKEFNGSQEAYDTYLSTRKFFDIVHDVRDEAVRKYLVIEKMRWITDTSSNFNSIGKVIEKLPDEVAHIWNVQSKSFNVVRTAAVQEHIRKGGKFVQLWKAHESKGARYDYAMISPSTKVTELPSSVLQYHPGYIPRMYKEPYYVRATVPMKVNGRTEINGKTLKREVTIGIAEGKLAGDRILEAFRKDPINEGVVVTVTRDTSKVVNPTPDPSTTSMFWEKRGDPLTNLETGALARVETPITAIHSTIKSLATTLGMSDYISNMTQRYIKSYGDSLTKPGVFSEPNSLLLGDIENAATAQAMYNEIKWLKAVDLDQDTVYKWVVDKVGHVLNSKSLNTYTNAPEALSNLIDRNMYSLSPTNTLRGTTFVMFVGSQLTRQLLQNSATILYTGLTNPVLATRAIGDTVSLIGAILTKDLKGPLASTHAAFINAMSKSMKVTPNEASEYLKDYMSLDLGASVDYHNMFASGVLERSDEIESIITSVALGAPRAVGTVLKGVKKVGFDAGEIFNLALHTSLARLQFLKDRGLPDNAKLTRSDLDTIASLARINSGNQNKTGTSAAQRVSPLGMNLLGFSVAMAGKMLYKDAVSKTLKNINKFDPRIKYIIGATITSGTAMYSQLIQDYEYYFDTEVPQVMKDILMSSAIDWATNKTLELITGEESDLFVSKSLSPANIYGLMSEFIHILGGDILGAVFGASGSATGDIVDAVRLAKATQMVPTLTTPQTALIILENAPKILKGYSDAAKVYWATQTGYFLSRKGEPIVVASLPHLLGRVVGIGTRTEDAIYAKQRLSKAHKKGEQAYVDDTVQLLISITKLGLSQNVYADIDKITKGKHPDWDVREVNDLGVRIANKFSEYLKGLDPQEKLLMQNAPGKAANRKTLESIASDPRFPKQTREKAEELLKSFSGD